MNLRGKLADPHKFLATTLSVFSFLLFTQTSIHFWPSFSYVFGIPIDYLAVAIYLTDLPLIVLVGGAVVVNDIRKKFWTTKFLHLALLLIGLACINLAVSVAPGPTLFRWVKVVELIFLGRLLLMFDKDALFAHVVKPIMLSVFIVVFIAILQIVLQSPTDYFSFLGERRFNLDTPGIAKRVILGGSVLRAYSTFSHPNSLAGFLLLAGAIGNYFFNRGNLKKIHWLAFLSVALLGLGLALSWSVLIYLTVALLLYKAGTLRGTNLTKLVVGAVAFSLALPLFTKGFNESVLHLPENIAVRLDQYSSLKFVNTKSVLFGYGLNTFTSYQKGVSFLPFSFQPVHNGFLLILFETGVFGFGLFVSSIFWLAKKVRVNKEGGLIFIVLLFLMLLDHYQLMLQQNMLLASVATAILLAED